MIDPANLGPDHLPAEHWLRLSNHSCRHEELFGCLPITPLYHDCDMRIIQTNDECPVAQCESIRINGFSNLITWVSLYMLHAFPPVHHEHYIEQNGNP